MTNPTEVLAGVERRFSCGLCGSPDFRLCKCDASGLPDLNDPCASLRAELRAQAAELALLRKVAEAADTHVHHDWCGSNVGCDCIMTDLAPSVRAWREGAKV